jgi:hypothetical protein
MSLEAINLVLAQLLISLVLIAFCLGAIGVCVGIAKGILGLARE